MSPHDVLDMIDNVAGREKVVAVGLATTRLAASYSFRPAIPRRLRGTRADEERDDEEQELSRPHMNLRAEHMHARAADAARIDSNAGL